MDRRDRMAVGFKAITTEVVNLNPGHGERYSIQHCVIKFVINLHQVGCFLRELMFPPPISTDLHHVTEMLLKVALNTITLTLKYY